MKKKATRFGSIATAISGETFRKGDASDRAKAVRDGESTALIQLAIRYAV